MPYSAGVHPIAIARSVQKTGLTYNNFRSPNSPLQIQDAPHQGDRPHAEKPGLRPHHVGERDHCQVPARTLALTPTRSAATAAPLPVRKHAPTRTHESHSKRLNPEPTQRHDSTPFKPLYPLKVGAGFGEPVGAAIAAKHQCTVPTTIHRA